MKRLELRLSNIEDAHIRVFAHSYGESDSVIPFDKGARRLTVLKALNALEFDPEDFSADEQEWMVDNGLLTKDKRAFRSDMWAIIGDILYKTLFPERSVTERALNNLTFEGGELQLQIEVDGEVEQHRLFDYPWELLSHGQDFLVERGVNVSRYIAYQNLPPDLPSLSHINVLLVSPRAFDLENGLKRLSDEESQAVRRGLERAKLNTKAENSEGEISIEIDEIPSHVTFQKFRRYVLEHHGEDTPHIIHFDGHGHFGVLCRHILPGGEECKTFNPGMRQKCKNDHCGAPLTNHQVYLLFEDNSGGPDYVSAQNIAATLGAANRGNTTGHGITLVVLSACKSGFSISGNSVFNGAAQRLISQRIPAVLGMAFTVTVDSTIAFTEDFYRSVRQKLPLVASVSWGRRAMLLDGNQWYRPVLYMRWQDNEGGQLFDSRLLEKRNERQQQTGNESVTLALATDGNLIRSVSMLVSPLPAFNPQWLRELDASGGAVPLDSQFYVERQDDVSAKEQILRPGVTLRIKGSRQVGKTSLLARLLQHAEVHEYPFIYIDFQDMEEYHFHSLDTLLYYLAHRIADERNTNQSPDTYWQGQMKRLGSKDKLTHFLSKEVLSYLNCPFILVLDEVDRLFAYEHFRNDFFSLIRSWHNKRAMPHFHVWKKLNIVLAYSTEAFLFISDINQSPFNVGTDYDLTDFDRSQVELVNYKHGSPVKPGKEMDCMMSLLHGHPFLVRKAWYALTIQRFTVEELLRRACDEDGPFEDHLRHYLLQLQKNREQSTAMKSVIQNHTCPNDYLFYQLRSAGLVAGSSRSNAWPRCGLYEQYFQKHL